MTDGRASPDFVAFEPLLWRVLGSLAKRGFVAPPLDARDVIHDFYLDAWERLQENFDERLSDFRTYLSSSFYKFARRRIVALHGWRQQLVDIDFVVDEIVDDRTPQRIVEQRQLMVAVHLALKKLPAQERVVLHEYLQESRPSERTIAVRHQISRYALRELLLNALGRIAVEMGRADGKRMESLVAFYLWHEGRSPQNVGELLGIAVVDVQKHKSEFASHLLLTLRGTAPASKTQEGKAMNMLEMLKATLLSPGDARLLTRLQNLPQSRGVVLDNEDDLDFTDEEARVLERNTEWVARVYSTLAGPANEAEDRDTIEDALLSLRRDAEREIGEAFVNLLQALEGSEFSDWERYFSQKLTVLHQDERDFFLEAPSFVEGIPNASILASYGLTPLMFHDCTRGMELLFDRLADCNTKFSESRKEACFPSVELFSTKNRIHIPGEIVVSQFATTPGMRPQAIDGMAHWLGDIIQRVPYLIRGYEAHWIQGRLHVQMLSAAVDRSEDKDDVVNRWTQVTTAMQHKPSVTY